MFSLEKYHINQSHWQSEPWMKRCPGKQLRMQTIKTSNKPHSLPTKVAQD
jgi:hypothetical protein